MINTVSARTDARRAGDARRARSARWRAGIPQCALRSSAGCHRAAVQDAAYRVKSMYFTTASAWTSEASIARPVTAWFLRPAPRGHRPAAELGHVQARAFATPAAPLPKSGLHLGAVLYSRTLIMNTYAYFNVHPEPLDGRPVPVMSKPNRT